MTTTEEHLAGTPRETADPALSLPLWPWTALHPATGMLLGADDFEVLAGNPRGKHRLHNAWLHGSGVVWGFGVRRSGDRDLEVSPGLALDGVGHELHLGAPRCVSITPLLEAGHDPTCGTHEVVLCLVAGFDACLDAPVPALANPCDVTRETQAYSRVVEQVRLDLVRGHPAQLAPPYHRVRVLLGLDTVGPDDEPGKQALVARNEVLATRMSARARELRWQFRCLAAADAIDWQPAGDACDPALFPTGDDRAGVVLGCLHLRVRDESGCPEIIDGHLDTCCRTTLLPTSVIQELACGLAPGLIGGNDAELGCGPQAVPDSIEWTPDGTEFSFEVTADLLPATLTRAAIVVCSLSNSGWVVEDLRAPTQV
ncbi:MAG: hypothetical protein QM695_16050 [Micropruina sp.]